MSVHAGLQIYKVSIRAADMICATLVNRHTDTYTQTDLTGYTTTQPTEVKTNKVMKLKTSEEIGKSLSLFRPMRGIRSSSLCGEFVE